MNSVMPGMHDSALISAPVHQRLVRSSIGRDESAPPPRELEVQFLRDTLWQREEGSLKLPKGMFKRGSSYYTRLFKGGRDKWISLGRDYEAAKEALASVGKRSRAPVQVAEAVKQWLADYVHTARNAKGIRMATSSARRYLVRFMGTRFVSEIAADDLRRYRLWLEGKELAPQTVTHVLCDARCFFGWCEEAEIVDRSPVPRRLMPKIQERLPDRLSAEEVVAMLQVPEPFGFVIRLGLGTGLRWAELCRALPSDVHGGDLHVSRSKSGKVRRIPVPPSLLAEIRAKEGRLVPYFENDPGSFSWHVRRLSGVERFHPHQMRHTFACQWLERGGNLPSLQQVLGHASIATTQRYARLSDESVREQARRTWQGEVVAVAVAGNQ